MPRAVNASAAPGAHSSWVNPMPPACSCLSNHEPTRAANWALRRPMCRSWAHFLRLCSPFRSRKPQATFDQKPSMGRSVVEKSTSGSSKPIGSPRSLLANALTVHAGCVGASAAGDIGTNAGAVSSVGPGAAIPFRRAAKERSAPPPGGSRSRTAAKRLTGAHTALPSPRPL